MTFLVRTAVFLATAYLAVLVILWAFQARFLYPAPQASAPLTSGYDEVQLETSDGLSLRAFYRKAASGWPTVIYFHGNGGTLRGASASNTALVEAGIGALLVEYRGYGGNPGEPSEQGFYLDGEAAMAWLIEQGIVPRETVIIGNSIGGGVATEMARRHDPAGLILVAPFTSLPDAVAGKLWWLPARTLVIDQYRNAEKFADLDMPVLIQHGDADNLISDNHGKTLSRLGKDAEFQPFVRSGHGLSFEKRSQEARRDWIFSMEIGIVPEG